MGKSLNWGEVEKTGKEFSGKGGGGFHFQIKDGETVPVKFLIPDDGSEPFRYKRHFVVGKGYHICAEDAVAEGKHQGCVICYQAKAQGKGGGTGLAQPVFAFSVFDPRKVHIFKEPTKVPGSDEPTRYYNCPDDPTCKFCRRDDQPKLNGLRYWSLAFKTAQQLRLWEHDVLGKNCAACGTGKIERTGYVCPTCEEDLTDSVDDPDSEVKCFECSKLSQKKGGPKNIMVQPSEVVRCKRGCKNARRVSLSDVWVSVTRTGAKTDTTYNFTLHQGDDPAEIPADLQPVNFKTKSELKPDPANEQAIKLGVSNPYRGGKAAVADDEDDTDDSDTDTDQDDDDDDSPSIFGNKRR